MEHISLNDQRLRFRWPMTAAMFRNEVKGDEWAE